MASVFVGSNVVGLDMNSDAGGNGLVEGSSTNSVDVEVQINLSNSWVNRLETIKILEQVIRYIQDGRTAVLPL